MANATLKNIETAIDSIAVITENTTIEIVGGSVIIKESGPEDILNGEAIPVQWLGCFDSIRRFQISHRLVAYMLKNAAFGNLRKNWGWI